MPTSSAPGNIFLMGEHSVVYGRSAIIAAIGLKTTCQAEKNNSGFLKISSECFGEASMEIKALRKPERYRNAFDPLSEICTDFFEKFGVFTGLELKISSDIPRNSGGMSSSTAVIVSVLDSLNKISPKLRKEQYYDFLLPVQAKIHGGKASGAEIFSSVFGGYSKIRINPAKREGLGNLDLPIMIVNTGIEAKTSDTVPYVRRGWELDKASYEEVFDRIQNIVQEGEKALKEKDLGRLGALMTINHDILAYELGVSHPKLNRIVKIALENGAYGAKLSGGGKGGAAIILADKDKQDIIGEKLKSIQVQVYRTEIGVSAL